MKTISHSGLRLFRACRRQYKHAYIDLRRSRSVAMPLALGKCWDDALQIWHHETGSQAKLLKSAPKLAQIVDPLQRAKLEAMLVGYTARWSDAPVHVVATQVQFIVPILHPESGEPHPEYQYMGILDGIALVGERLMVLESKTTSEDITPGSAYWQHVASLDTQVSMYMLGATQAGHAVEGVIYDVARKPELRPKKDESAEAYRDRCALDIQARPDWYFQRQEIVRLESEANAYAQDLWDYACDLTIAERTARWPRNPDNCRKYGRPCDYLPVCASEASIDDPVLYRTTERKDHEPSRSHPARPAA